MGGRVVVEIVVGGPEVVEPVVGEDRGVVGPLVEVEDGDETAVSAAEVEGVSPAGAGAVAEVVEGRPAGDMGVFVFGVDPVGWAWPLVMGSGRRLKAEAQPAVAPAPMTPARRARNRRRVRSGELISCA